MKDHSSQLVELRLRLIPYHQFDWTLDDVSDPGPIASIDQDAHTILDSCFNNVFSSLRHLSLYVDDPSLSLITSVRQFLLRHSDQLLSLHLLPHNIRHDGILPPNFMLYFQLENGRFVSFSLLQDLSIYSSALDIELVSFLATSLPLLRYLCIGGLLSLSVPTSSASFQDLERMLQSWELSDLDLLGETRRWKFDDRERLVCLFAGAKRICGRLSSEWAKDREFSASLLPLRMRVAPNYYDQDD
ncbi:hypothetical protein BJ165DRAFT_1469288 [Panaeolus papilionaceus]|nr:hypothetical protein BJ165DRAFT_1469288 [Panaeolus papilionaceus]